MGVAKDFCSLQKLHFSKGTTLGALNIESLRRPFQKESHRKTENPKPQKETTVFPIIFLMENMDLHRKYAEIIKQGWYSQCAGKEKGEYSFGFP